MSTRSCIMFDSEDIGVIAPVLYRHCDGYPEGLGKDLLDAYRATSARPGDGGYGYERMVRDIIANDVIGDIRFVQTPDFETDDPRFLAKLNTFANVIDAEYVYHIWREGKSVKISVYSTEQLPFSLSQERWEASEVEPELLYSGDIEGMVERFGFGDGPKA